MCQQLRPVPQLHTPAQPAHLPPSATHPPQARNARRAEDHLLSIAKQYGVGRLNRQWVSNYPDVCGYVYCIVGQVLNPHQVAGMQQGYCQPGYSHQQECCTIM